MSLPAKRPGRAGTLHFGTCSYVSLKSILQNNLEAQPLEQELPLPSPVHENLRGAPYYH